MPKNKNILTKERKAYVNAQIIAHYPEEPTKLLADRLGITVAHLRIKARRLGVRKKRVNDVIDGKKKCPHCGLMRDVECFNRDSYQANNFDYYCRTCRTILKRIEDINNGNNDSLAFNKGKYPNEVIIIDDRAYLKCKSCDRVQPIDEYSLDRKMSHGHRNTCKACEMLKRRGLRWK